MSYSKTEIRKMNKGDASDILKNLNLPSEGKRPELIERLLNHFHGEKHTTKENITKETISNVNINPIQNDSTKTENKPEKIKIITQPKGIVTMKKDELQKHLELCGLSTDGSRKELIPRLKNYFEEQKLKTQSEINFNETTKTENFKAMNKEALKNKCLTCGLSADGTKTELIKKLESFYENKKNKTVNNEICEKKEEIKEKIQDKIQEDIKKLDQEQEQSKKQFQEEYILVDGIEESNDIEYSYEEVEFDKIRYGNEYIYVYNDKESKHIVCRYNESEKCYELTDKKWNHITEEIY